MNETELEFYPDTANVWNVMYEACSEAQSSIFFEQYILCDDACGGRFLKLFIEKARSGIAVSLILDRVGSHELCHSSVIAELEDAGGKVYFYNPLSLSKIFLPGTWLPRNHIKTMIVDSRIAFVGSACHAEFMRTWHDLQARITGPLVRNIERDFLSILRKLERGQMTPVSDIISSQDTSIRYAVTQPGIRASPIYKELLLKIRGARSHIYLVTPYFLPPRRLQSALRDAVRRGVDVRVMMSKETDIRLADHVAQTYFPSLLSQGIRIFLYRTTVLHAKYAIIDDDWATIGSTNMDYLSLLTNREANLLICRKELVAQLRNFFLSDMELCSEVTLNYYRRIHWSHKIIGYMGRAVKKVL